ncbi:MAG: HAMP domain-containing sensor histidine kinase [Polyangiaceae bacterium]
MPAAIVDEGGTVLASSGGAGALPPGIERGAVLTRVFPGVDMRHLLGGDAVHVSALGGSSLRLTATPLSGGRVLVAFCAAAASEPDGARSAERVEVAARTIAAVRHELAGIIQTLMNQPFIARRAFARSPEQGMTQLATMDEQINMLLERLRGFDRLPAALRTPDRRTVDVGDLLVALAQAEPRVRLQTPSAPCEVCGDHVQLAAALGALIKNALEFSPPESVVDVALTVAGDMLAVTFEDRGASAWQPSPHGVHDPFYTTKHRDLGLGLTVAHAVASRHGGQLEVTPRPGGGTCVTLRLPVGAYPGKPVDDSTVRPLP